ncbi:hypothetical protein ES708_17372 [subsurface metagenome]
MEKIKYEKELEKASLSNLCRRCEGKGLDYTGNREALIARLVAWEESQSEEPAPEPEPEVEPPATEPATEPGEAPPAEE